MTAQPLIDFKWNSGELSNGTIEGNVLSAARHVGGNGVCKGGVNYSSPPNLYQGAAFSTPKKKKNLIQRVSLHHTPLIIPYKIIAQTSLDFFFRHASPSWHIQHFFGLHAKKLINTNLTNCMLSALA